MRWIVLLVLIAVAVAMFFFRPVPPPRLLPYTKETLTEPVYCSSEALAPEDLRLSGQKSAQVGALSLAWPEKQFVDPWEWHPGLSLNGKPGQIKFDGLIFNEDLWSTDAKSRNELRYRASLGNPRPAAYRTTGFVTLEGQTYLGIAWCPSTTGNPVGDYFTLRLEPAEGGLRPVVVFKQNMELLEDQEPMDSMMCGIPPLGVTTDGHLAIALHGHVFVRDQGWSYHPLRDKLTWPEEP